MPSTCGEMVASQQRHSKLVLLLASPSLSLSNFWQILVR